LLSTVGPQAIDPFWLKQYISDLLISPEYSFKYVRLPYLVGSYLTSDIINYQDNRRKFVNRHFYNKYKELPNLQQLHQASWNMLQWWSTFETEYWELPNGTRESAGTSFTGLDPDSPPRRDVFVAAPTNSGATRRSYNAGEIAVDFLFNLATETEFIRGVPYILSTERLRENKFTIVLLMHQLWKSNADVISDSEVDALAKLPLSDAITLILSDIRYTSRFNNIWKESELLGDNFPNWKKEDWKDGSFSFMDKCFPWIYHEDLEWIFIAGVSQTAFWFYSDKLGWVWTGSSHYPYVYSNNESSWVRFFDKDDKLNLSINDSTVYRYLYIYKTSKYVRYDLY
jgi:hypothetical protein